MKHEAFVSGNFNTKFIENYFKPEYLNTFNNNDEAFAFAAGELFYKNEDSLQQQAVEGKSSNWLQNRKA
jgi:propionyl-CoA carboxylase alpha chain